VSCLILLLLNQGCRSTNNPAPTEPPIPPVLIPKKAPSPRVPQKLIAPESFTVPQAKQKPIDRFITLSYPTDYSNYMWEIQESVDKVNWYHIDPTNYVECGFQYGTNFYWVGGTIYAKSSLPQTNFNITVYIGTNNVKFWRTHGIHPYNP